MFKLSKQKWIWLILLVVVWFGAGLAVFANINAPAETAAAEYGPPQRIVSLAPNLTEILFALGLEERIVGVTQFSNYPPAAGKINKVGAFWAPNLEAIIATKPDLLVTVDFQQQTTVARRLSRIGYNTLTFDIRKVAQLFDAITKIGAATATDAKAAEMITDTRSKLGDLSALVKTDSPPKVLWVVQREPLRVAGKDTFVTEMIELAGGRNAISSTIHKYPPIGPEQVIACRPDVIIEPAMHPGRLESQRESALKYWNKSQFENVPAVINNCVYVIDGDLVSRLGSRFYQGVEKIARCMNPQLFQAEK